MKVTLDKQHPSYASIVYWVESLGLGSHPEGGYYKETYRSNESILQRELPERFGGDRVFSTAIYFLIPGGGFSAFHRISSDEMWHFYSGCELLIHQLLQLRLQEQHL